MTSSSFSFKAPLAGAFVFLDFLCGKSNVRSGSALGDASRSARLTNKNKQQQKESYMSKDASEFLLEKVWSAIRPHVKDLPFRRLGDYTERVSPSNQNK